MSVAEAKARRGQEVSRVEAELRTVIRKLQRWSREVEQHHIEIAKRNFAIGLEIAGFIETFPPRSYPGLDIMRQISQAVKLSPSYLSLISRVSSWLYQNRVRSIASYMNQNELRNWSSIVDSYIIASGGSEDKIILSRRWTGAKASLANLRSALPKKDRVTVDEAIKQLEEVVLPRLD